MFYYNSRYNVARQLHNARDFAKNFEMKYLNVGMLICLLFGWLSNDEYTDCEIIHKVKYTVYSNQVGTRNNHRTINFRGEE
jgi:hypothetical protein